MSETPSKEDELAGTEQPFVQHLMELRDRLLYSIYGIIIAVIALAIWPGPDGLMNFIAQPIKMHMPPDGKLIAVGVFSPFIVPLKVLAMAAVLLALPWIMYQLWAFVAPGLYSHEKRFALPLIFFGSMLAYIGIAFVQLFVLDRMFGFIQHFTPSSVAATPDIASYVEAILSLYLAFGLAFAPELLAAVAAAATRQPVIGLVNELHSEALAARIGGSGNVLEFHPPEMATTGAFRKPRAPAVGSPPRWPGAAGCRQALK